MTDSVLRCFDSHCHIIDPDYPLVENQGYLPEPFGVEDYTLAFETLPLTLCGGAIVSGSFQAFDTQYLVNALSRLGPNFVGVVNLRHDSTDDEIHSLHAQGVRAVRFNLYRGGSEVLDRLEELAWRVYRLVGWHVELYVSSEKLYTLKPLLKSLPLICIDHLGLSQSGFDDLLELVDHGAYVKATRFSVLDFNIKHAMKCIFDCGPDRLVFGTDLPGTRAPRCVSSDDVNLLVDTFNAEELNRVLFDNAMHLYHRRFN